jgi:hypothetical protein
MKFIVKKFIEIKNIINELKYERNKKQYITAIKSVLDIEESEYYQKTKNELVILMKNAMKETEKEEYAQKKTEKQKEKWNNYKDWDDIIKMMDDKYEYFKKLEPKTSKENKI